MPTKWIKAGSGGADPPERLRLLQVIVIKAMRPDRQLYALEVLYPHTYIHTYIHTFLFWVHSHK
jgi:hypothetical protein